MSYDVQIWYERINIWILLKLFQFLDSKYSHNLEIEYSSFFRIKTSVSYHNNCSFIPPLRTEGAQIFIISIFNLYLYVTSHLCGHTGMQGPHTSANSSQLGSQSPESAAAAQRAGHVRGGTHTPHTSSYCTQLGSQAPANIFYDKNIFHINN